MTVAMAVPVVGVATPAPSRAAPVDGALPSSGTTPRPTHDGSVDDATGAPTATAPDGVQSALRTRIESNPSAQLTIEVVTTGASAEAAATAVGGDVVRELDGLALVTVAARQVHRLAAQPGVTQVRLPTDMRHVMARSLPPRPETGPTQSAFAERLGSLYGPGGAGIGQRIGIIDYFDASLLTQQATAGELQTIPASRTRCISAGTVCGFGTVGADYGNAIAEIVADVVPFADLYLAEIGGGTDYLAAIDWMAANGVTTVMHRWMAAYDGPGNGTGFSAAVIDYAVSKGILWVNAAGEQGSDPNASFFGGPHWRGTWSDGDNDRWLNFSGSDESLTAYCGGLMGLRWSDWAASKTDYDLYISDFRANTNTNGTRALVSAFNQGTGGAAPLEANDLRWLCNHDPALGPVYDTNGDNFVSLWVYRTTRSTHTPVGDVLEISVISGWLEYSTSVASGATPFADTKSKGALVIGATNDSTFAPWWSSRGPTNDGRVRPDFIAETCILTSITPAGSAGGGGCTQGLVDTAGPAATVAGYAALLSPRLAMYRPSDRARRFVDGVGAQGYGNLNGSGVGALVYADSSAPFSPVTEPGALQLRPTPRRVLETRPAQGLVGVDTPGPIPPDTSIRVPLYNMGLAAGDVALFNVTIVTPPALGWVQVYPPSVSWIGASSNLNVAVVGSTVPNLVAVRLDSGDAVMLYSSGGGHMVVDLLGAFKQRHPQVSSQGRYVGLTPYRVADTTTCQGVPVGCTGAPVAGATAIDVPLAGTGSTPDNGIPDTGNYAAVVSVTATPGAAGGWASVLPGGSTGSPSTSTLNFRAGSGATNMAIVPLSDSAGSMRLFTSVAAHYRVDVLGYFRVPTNYDDPAGLFVAPAPTRLLDTRSSGGAPIPPNGTTTVAMGSAGRWSGSDDVWLNLTSTLAAGAGTLQVSADSSSSLGSHINVSVAGANRTVASAALTRMSGRTATVRTSVSTHVVADLVGWFTPAEPLVQPGQIQPVTRQDGTPVGPNVALESISADSQIMLITGTVDSPGVVTGSTLTRWDRTDDTLTSVDVRTDNSVFEARGSLSGDGDTVLLVSTSDNIVPGDTDGASDVFVRTLAGTLEMVSVNGAEQPTTVAMDLLSSSDDGNRILLSSTTTVPGWGTGTVHLRDRVAGTTTALQSRLPAGTRGTIVHARISGDGTRVVALLREMEPYETNAGVIYRLAFIDVAGGTPRVTGFGISRNGVQIDDPRVLDVSPSGSHAVVSSWLVGFDGTFVQLPGEQTSNDNTVVMRNCTLNYNTLCKVYTVAGGPEGYARDGEGYAGPSPERAFLASDGSGVYYSTMRTITPGAGGRIFFYALAS